MENNLINNIKPYKLKKGEEFMSDSFVAHIKHILVSWREQLVYDVENTIHNMHDNTSQVADINDRATLEEEFSVELRTRDRERKLIDKIDKTLHSIELGSYGYCITCGADINISRLEARPTANQCIDCKTISEKKEL